MISERARMNIMEQRKREFIGQFGECPKKGINGGWFTYNKLVEVLTKNYNINKSTAKDVIKKWKQLEKTRWEEGVEKCEKALGKSNRKEG